MSLYIPTPLRFGAREADVFRHPRVAVAHLADRCAATTMALEVRERTASAQGRVGEAYELQLDLGRARVKFAEARDAARYAQLSSHGVENALNPLEAYGDPNQRNLNMEVLALGQPRDGYQD